LACLIFPVVPIQKIPLLVISKLASKLNKPRNKLNRLPKRLKSSSNRSNGKPIRTASKPVCARKKLTGLPHRLRRKSKG